MKELENARQAKLLIEISKVSNSTTAYINQLHRELSFIWYKLSPRLKVISESEGDEAANDYFLKELSTIFENVKKEQKEDLEKL